MQFEKYKKNAPKKSKYFVINTIAGRKERQTRSETHVFTYFRFFLEYHLT